ncbi:hypothetical protein E2C01_035808 [Portunus trituberculatus]|uniref:Uncharacterized protein n=1 Tax=Portunus trituberculatus TaxID=210409 RepID=A0A5B7FAQ3_PORTR|nr:hypothetical protein [Portunus trituberculatus]
MRCGASSGQEGRGDNSGGFSMRAESLSLTCAGREGFTEDILSDKFTGRDLFVAVDNAASQYCLEQE